jgi:hypothetical protein
MSMNTKEVASDQQEFFKNGKMDMGFEVNDGYVVGVCLLYQSRADQEHEYMIREKSIVKVGEQGLSACVQEAKDLAYQSAISRVDGVGNVLAFPTRQTPSLSSDQPGDEADHADQEQTMSIIAPTDSAEPVVNQSYEAQPPAPAAHEPEYDPACEDNGDDDSDGEEPVSTQENGVQRLDLSGLKPASTLLNNSPPAAQQAAPADNNESAMQKALAMPITILGKLHTSFGKTAGEILRTDPQCIVDFAHRYTGPKVEEKEALCLLYPEALRSVKNAA